MRNRQQWISVQGLMHQYIGTILILLSLGLTAPSIVHAHGFAGHEASQTAEAIPQQQADSLRHSEDGTQPSALFAKLVSSSCPACEKIEHCAPCAAPGAPGESIALTIPRAAETWQSATVTELQNVVLIPPDRPPQI